MTQIDYVALGIKLFGPQCLELSHPPDDIRFGDHGEISLSAVNGQITIGDTAPIEMPDLVKEVTERKKRNGSSGRTIVAQFITERKACSRDQEPDPTDDAPATDTPKEGATREPDQDQIEIFVQALFRHCDPSGVVSLRSFHQEDSSKSFGIKPIPLKDGLKPLIKAAVKEARRAANAFVPVAFTPPVATFKASAGWHAREEDLLEGPVLSVELMRTRALRSRSSNNSSGRQRWSYDPADNGQTRRREKSKTNCTPIGD